MTTCSIEKKMDPRLIPGTLQCLVGSKKQERPVRWEKKQEANIVGRSDKERTEY